VEMRSGLTDVAMASPNYFVVCKWKGQGARTGNGRAIPRPRALRGKAAPAVTRPPRVCLSAVLGGMLGAWQNYGRSTSTRMSRTAETFLRD
jgi:hypothetical protein